MNTLIRCWHLAVALPELLTPERQRKLPYWGLALTVLVLFGDVLLPWLGHVLLLALEVVEATFDHFVESVFEVDSYTSQLITAWTGFFTFIFLLVKAYRWVMRAYADIRDRVASWCHTHAYPT